MKKLPMLYKRATTGAEQQWQIIIDGDSFYTISGQVGGALVQSAPRKCKGKNIGKTNETSPESQAELEAQSKFEKKLKANYFESLADIDNEPKFFQPTLAKKYKEHRKRVTWPRLASRKINGLRVANLKESITTRKGEDVVACPHIVRALAPFFQAYPDGMVDGEGYAHGEFFEDVIGIFRTLKPTAEDLIESEKKAQLWIYDGYTSDPNEPFKKRFSDLKAAILKTVAKEHLKYFVFVENTIVHSHEEFMVEHDKYVAEGFEGAMLRDETAPYERKRTSKLLKYKNFIDDEFLVLDILEGEGNDAGKASKILVQLPSGGTSEAGIRGRDEYVRKILREKDYYIGKLATVRYQGYTKHGKLQFGVAVCLDPIDR